MFSIKNSNLLYPLRKLKWRIRNIYFNKIRNKFYSSYRVNKNIIDHDLKDIFTDAVDRKPRVLYLGTDYDQDHSGFVQALSQISEVKLFYKNDESYGHVVNNKKDREKNGKILEKYVAEFQPDLIMMQSIPLWLPKESLKSAKKEGAFIINIWMDEKLPELWVPRRKYGGRIIGPVGFGDAVDLYLTTCSESLQYYSYHGLRAKYFPLASDPTYFYPHSKKEYDVVFVGWNYGDRKRIIHFLEASGVSVTKYGHGFPAGRASREIVTEIFSKAKIILGIGLVELSDDIYNLKLRDFDALMAGTVYITHPYDQLLSLFKDGEDLLTYRNDNELLIKIQEILESDENRKKIGQNAREKVLKHHTWEKRIKDLFQELGWQSIR